MKATVTKGRGYHGVLQNRKEGSFTEEYTIHTLAKRVKGDRYSRPVVTARIYRGAKGTRTYACVWLNGIDAAGGAFAGGGGYHKASAAVQYALKAAGVSLSENIAGCGDNAIEEALLAVAKAISGAQKAYFIHKAHG